MGGQGKENGTPSLFHPHQPLLPRGLRGRQKRSLFSHALMIVGRCGCGGRRLPVFKMADGDDLEAIRAKRLAELQAQHGGVRNKEGRIRSVVLQ